MNYRHVYHAGNFADVLKHWVLSLILEHLCKKESAYGFLDTHAGIGLYDLNDPQMQKTGEFLQGIVKLLEQKECPASFEPYLKIVKACQVDEKVQVYPGSPWIAHAFQRPQDSLILCELHPEDVQTLKQNFAKISAVHIHHRNAYETLKACLPLKEKRGLVLIDPPYEKKEELETILKALQSALKHFASGIFQIWYPIKNVRENELFFKALKTICKAPILKIELVLDPDNENQLKGSGVLVINPPWKLQETLTADLPFLCKTLALSDKSFYELNLL